MSNNNPMFQMHLLQKEKQLREMEAQLIALQQEYYKILNSKFWKSTQWIRNIINIIRPAKPTVQNDTPLRTPEQQKFTQRISTDKLVKILVDYDIVSFDIFDTLILRNCKNPIDVFDIVALKTDFEGFSSLRIQAEEYARNITENEDKEINLAEIYKVFGSWTSLDTQKFINREIETELSLCTANPYMKQVFDTLRALDKKIIITTDMYLPQSAIIKILDSCGYYGYEQLFISNEIGCSKASGKLYQYISNIYTESNIIHIGDNYHSDIVNSTNNGWQSFYYPSCKNISDFADVSPSSPASDIRSGMIINKFYNGADNYSIAYRHGYSYGGIITVGYCNWLNKFAIENRTDKILFLARDAEIFETMFKKYINNVPHEYMVVSRFSMWQIVFDIHTEEYIRFFFKNRALSANSSVEDALAETGLDFLIDELESFNINKEEIISNDNYNRIREFIYSNKDLISTKFKPMRDAATKYFNQCFGNSKRIVLSDVGWSGQILLHMRHFVKEVMKRTDIEIIGAYLATSMRKDVNHYVNNGILNAYLYTYGQNRDMYMPIDNFAGNTAVMCLEAMFSSVSPTLMEYRIDDNGNFDFVYGTETGIFDTLNDIQKGILDFAKDWYSITQNIGTSINVHPADAFSPYESIAMDWNYLSIIFENFTEYTDSIPRLGKTRQSVSLVQIMHERGLL